MRLGLISDLHGNLPALEAVLGELEREGVERIVCLGDVAVGPLPSETLNRVRDLGCPVVMGNWDAAFVAGLPPATDELSQMLNEINGWWSEQLTDEDREFTRSFVPTLELELDGLPVLCFHGSPRSYDEVIVEHALEALGGAGVVDVDGGRVRVDLRRTPFDVAGFLSTSRASGMPHAEWWADCWVTE